MKLSISGAVASIVVLFAALFLRRVDIITDPVAVTLVVLGVVGFAGCTIWTGVGSLRRSARSR